MLSTEARTLAGALRALVNSVDRSLREITEEAGLAHSTVSQWMSGQYLPSTPSLAKLLDACRADERTQQDLFALHYNASGKPQPDYAGVARYVIERTALSARDVADVLDALVTCVHVTDAMCATTIDARDLRSVAAVCTAVDQMG